jgi:hypothetical protein
MSAPVTVTQADRDAAADYLASIGQPGSADICRAGKGWTLTAQAFAASRIATEAAFRAREAELVEALERVFNFAIAAQHQIDPDWNGEFFDDSDFGFASAALARAKASSAEGV